MDLLPMYKPYGSRTKGNVEKIETLSKILKERYYYLNDPILQCMSIPKHLVVSLIYSTLGRLYITN
jgi:hypothetical protein